MKLHASVVLASVLLCACSRGADKAQPTLNETMLNGVAPTAQVLWDDISLALTDNGAMDTSRLDEKQWQGLAKAASDLAAQAQRLEQARKIVVAKPGVKILNEGLEGAATAADVQHAVDGDPAGFSEHAGELRAIAGEFSVAIRARDADRLGKLASELDSVCEDCHGGFWVSR